MSIPYQGRVIVNDSNDGLEITILYKKNLFSLIIGVFMLCIFLVISLVGIFSLVTGSPVGIAEGKLGSLMLGDAIVGTALFVYCFRSLLREVRGIAVEAVITIRAEQLILIKKSIWFDNRKVYDINDVSNFSFQDIKNNPQRREFNFSFIKDENLPGHISVGYICFYYENEKLGFGVPLEEPDARYILQKLAEKRNSVRNSC